MQAQVITIGDEILIGQIIDSNSAWIGEQLNLQGIKIKNILSISDDRDAIIDALKMACEEVDLILITGGLGPTKDDITKFAIAEFLEDDLVYDQNTFDRITKLFARFGRKTTDAHKAQCYMPSKAKLLINKMGTAPGMLFEYRDTIIVSMPGVPYEMKYLMTNEVLPYLRAKGSDIHIKHKTIRTAGEGESRIAKHIEDIVTEFPDYLKIAYLPSLGTVRLRISGEHQDAALLESSIEQYRLKLIQRLGDLVFGYDKDLLQDAILKLANHKSQKIATAESCTGGMIASRLTSVSGSSSYFQGSIIAYSNDIKRNLLDVKSETLSSYGAVSENTVIEMVSGALKLLNVDVAVAVSGIAGPTGGTNDKPVGTIWIAVGNQNETKTLRLNLSKDRQKNVEYTTHAAMNMLRKFLMRL